MRNKTREEVPREVEERTKTMVKELLEAFMREEREISRSLSVPAPS